ncbi:MAG: hypothetical protein ACE5QW_09755, partial [Thermoplasmata archaeon]
MILAELHGRAPDAVSRWEDPLTSNVFGVLKNIDRQLGLGCFLRLTGIPQHFSNEEYEDAEFIFWEARESKDGKIRREPDVIIEIGSTTIFVEAKYKSSLYEEQLLEEYAVGKQYPDFYLVCVTDDLTEPDEVEAAREKGNIPDGRLIWVGWQMIWEELKELSRSSGIDKPSKRFVEDVIELLEKKGLTKFRPFGDVGLGEEDIKRARQTLHDFMRQVFTFTRELQTRLQDTGLKKGFSWGMVDRDGTSRSSDWHKWLMTEIGPVFVDEAWKEYESDNPHAYLFATFEMEEPSLCVGYGFRITEKTRERLRAGVDRLGEHLDRSVSLDFYSASGRVVVPQARPEDLNEEFFEESGARDARWVEMYVEYSLSERNLVDNAEKTLLKFRD